MPECCGKQMTEVESPFTNELNEYEIVAYRCDVCGRTVKPNGEEIG